MSADHRSIETPTNQIESLTQYYLALKKRPDLKDLKLLESTFRQALAGVSILKELNPSHLLALAEHDTNTHIMTHPDSAESLTAFKMIKEAKDRIDRGEAFTAIDAIIAVFKARDVTDIPWYKPIRANNLVTILPATIESWYQRRTTIELCITKELQEKTGKLSAMEFSLQLAQQELEQMKLGLEAKEEGSAVGSVQQSVASRMGAVQQSKLEADSKKLGRPSKQAQKYSPAFYLFGIRKKITSVLQREEAVAYAQSIEADYAMLFPYINEQGLVALPPLDDNNADEVARVNARLHALETSLDYLVKKEALKLGATIGRKTHAKDFARTITLHVLNLYTSGGNILFQADSGKVNFYKSLWDERFEAENSLENNSAAAAAIRSSSPIAEEEADGPAAAGAAEAVKVNPADVRGSHFRSVTPPAAENPAQAKEGEENQVLPGAAVG